MNIQDYKPTATLDNPTEIELSLIRHNRLAPDSRYRRYLRVQIERCKHYLKLADERAKNEWNQALINNFKQLSQNN